MIRTLFVLDFDGTYDNEDEESYGVEPLVYLIPLDRQIDVERIAYAASKEFNENADGSDMCIGDLFEQELEAKGIEFQQVGNLHIPFHERETDYLADYIPIAVV